jgi:transcriptional regulator with XRE-family HTH domain
MKLQHYLVSKETTQAEFARRIRVKPPTVCRYVKGERIPEPDVMRRIYAATDGNVTANDFMDLLMAIGADPGATDGTAAA